MKKSLKNILELHQKGKLTEAEQHYLELLDTQPENADLLHLLGILNAQKKNYKKALYFLEKAIAIEPYAPTFYNSLGNVYKHLMQTDAAIKAYYKAIELKPNSASALNNLGVLLAQQGQLNEALKQYESAIHLKPDYADAYYNLGDIFQKQGKSEKAIKPFQKAIELDPQHIEAHIALGKLFHQNKQFSQAIQHYEACLNQEENIDVLNNLGAIFLEQKAYKKALTYFKKALHINPLHVESCNNAGHAYLGLNEIDKALKAYLNALEIKRDAETLYNIGVLYMHKDHHDTAIHYFEDALKENKENVNIYLNLGTIYLKKEDHPRAIAYYKKALTLSPNHPETLYLLSALEGRTEFDRSPDEYVTHLFDQYAPYFDTHLKNYLNYHSPEKIYETLTHYLGTEKAELDILDLGCGTGLCGELLRPLARHLTGIDLSSQMIEYARQKGCYDELEVIAIEDYLSKETRFDLIIGADVFTYIGDLRLIFERVYSSLNPSGLFTFTTEKTHKENYVLQASARFAHHPHYIETLAKQFNLQRVICNTIILRTQKKKPLEGDLWMLKKS